MSAGIHFDRRGVRDFRDDIDARERGVPALVGVERRDAHEPMHAALGVQITVGIFAAHEQRDRFDPDFFALLDIDRLRAESAPLDPALIHPQKHVGPIARLRPARAGVNRHEGIRAIILAREKLPQLELLEFLHESRVFRRDFLFRSGARRRVGFLRGELLAALRNRRRPVAVPASG